MDEAYPEKKNNKLPEILIAITLITITAIAVIYLLYPTLVSDQPRDDVYEEYTQFFTNITAQAANDIINSTTNLSIIDVRGLEGCGSCQFKNDGHLPGAVLNSNPNSLINETHDILVYSKDGGVGANFCKDLINQVKGKIYNLNGGIQAWIAAGYKLEYGA